MRSIQTDHTQIDISCLGQNSTISEWGKIKNILIILAHPDDPEFSCGATIAKWTSIGHIVSYCILTNGDKGGNFPISRQELIHIRKNEQTAAAAVLGVHKIQFLDYPDGYIVPDIELRKIIVRIIRSEKPEVIITSDPTNLFPRPGYINHPDHRATGQVVIDAAFPAAGNEWYFPDLLQEGLLPHSLQELWLANPSQPDYIVDVTQWWEQKLDALHEHASQIGEKDAFDEKIRSRHTPESTREKPKYEEKFRRIIFS